MIELLVILLVVGVSTARLWVPGRELADGPGGAGAWRPTAVVRVHRPLPTVQRLTVVEARELLRHPLVLVALVFAGIGLVIPGVVLTDSPVSPYLELSGSGATAFYPPVLAFLGACACANRSRRDGTDELLAAAPASRVQRTLSSCAAALGLAGVGVVIMVAGYVAYRIAGVDSPVWPTIELLNWPLTLLGAGTLAVMVSRWLPWRGMPLVVLVGLVAISMAVSNGLDSRWISYSDFVPWEAPPGGFVRPPRDLVVGHAIYLFGLDAMAVVGAVLRDDRRTRWWLLGAAAVLVAAAGGALQA